ncbi:hypothetical protein EZJ43_14815 [Pedobacter changchengzhani]|uniref:Uncharacterized protein n=1 Tax=Pedobacter changchengzhani TaxID=2529274 RepID=A0A4R5MHX5_9SPHI|nr:hypothetical protein [Pedobacter changchengzhani]TDG35170.1 hypothetical protein EZJ43_14815 [Pedobacter changchengzhani]
MKENPDIFEQIKTKYKADMALRKALPVNYLPIFILIGVAIFQFYLCATEWQVNEKIEYTYFAILFFTCTLTLIPEAVSDKKMGKSAAILITVIFSLIISGLYTINPIPKIFYIVIFAYLNVIYHLIFANQKQIEKNTTSGGCMLLLFILVIAIASILAFNSSMFRVFANKYNMYYFFNGLYFIAMSWINYNTQKHV